MPNKKSKAATSHELLMDRYMSYVLDNEDRPKSVYKFCKENNFEEQDFYAHFGSLEGLKKAIWDSFYDETHALIHKNEEFEAFSNKDKLLTFYFSFFELLGLHRSYVLFTLEERKNMLENLGQLRGLRNRFKTFARGIIEEGNATRTYKFTKRSPAIFSEAAWIQLLFLLKFWLDDASPGFEKTDVAIEKSVQTAFDLFENTPLENILDFGKFLYKERMA